MNTLKIKCTFTDRSGRKVDIDVLPEKDRLRAAEKIAVRAMETLYGPDYVVKAEKKI